MIEVRLQRGMLGTLLLYLSLKLGTLVLDLALTLVILGLEIESCGG